MNKTWYQFNSFNYELYSIHYHRNSTKQISWYWRDISESILYDSGFITDFNKFRLKKKEIFESEKRYYNPIREYGLDGISFDENNTYHGIQSKLYNPKSYLTANDLGTFFSVIYNRLKSKNNNSKGYLYHTCKLQIDLRDDIDNSKGHIVRSLLPYNETIQNDFIETKNNEIKINEVNFTLRTYQKEAIDALEKEWNGVKLMNLPCGTGKTVIFCNHVKEKEYKNIFIISPLKIHVKQNLDRMKKFLPDYEALLLDSDTQGSTDFHVLEENLNKNSIISTTFDSAQNILKKIFYEEYDYEEDLDDDCEENDYEEEDLDDDCEESVTSHYESKYDLSNSILIVDEAHNLINKDELIKIVKSFPKVLLVTATPPSCMEEVMSCDLIYQYPFRKAIEEKYICDYQIYLPLLTMDEHTGISTVDIEKPIELKDLDTDLIQKSLYLINGMLQTGSRKCIAYLSSQEECNQFTNVFSEVMKKYHYLPFWIKSIICDISDKERKNLLEEFQSDDKENSIKIICSIRILNEGIDIPNCDAVFIGNVGTYSSDITMVQRICRANRLIKRNPNKIAHCFLWTDDLNKIVNSLSLLKENDIEFHKKIKIMNGNYDQQNEKIMIEKIEKENNLLNDFIKIKCMSYQDIWEMKKNLLFEFCDINKRTPTEKEEYQNVKIKSWLQNQKNKINNIEDNLYKKLSENIYVKKSLDENLVKKEENKDKEKLSWEEKRDLLFEFCNINKRIPTKKEEYENVKIRDWLQDQKKKINNIEDNLYKKLSKNIYVKKSLDKFLVKKEENKDKEKLSWEEWKELLFEFCNINKRIPTYKEEDENAKIYNWLIQQKTKINSIKDDIYIKLSENIYIKKSLDEFLVKKEKNNDKKELSWDEKKELLFIFCNINKRVPIQKEKYENVKIGAWLSHQKEKINNIEDDLYKKLSENIYIKKSLDEFLKKKKENNDKKELNWKEKRDLLFEFCNIHKRMPTQREEYENIQIGRWLGCQKAKINLIEDDMYKQLSENKYVKISLDEYLKNKENRNVKLQKS